VARSIIRGDILPLPQYAFMALCSVKAQGKLYLLSHDIRSENILISAYYTCEILTWNHGSAFGFESKNEYYFGFNDIFHIEKYL
jgi:hypothetical protein